MGYHSARGITRSAGAVTLLALAACGAPVSSHAHPSRHAIPAPSLTRTQQGYVCADLKALHVPGQPNVVYLLPYGRGNREFEFDPAYNDAGLSFVTATIPQMKAMIMEAVSARCPRFTDLQLSWP